MKPSPETVSTVVGILTTDDREATRAAATVPEQPGLYAWWAPPAVLPDISSGCSHRDGSARLLYIGRADRLRTRLVGHHLRASRTSTLRRTLAGLLMDDAGWETVRSGLRRRVVLTRECEADLSAWMARWLTFTACPVPDPETIEVDVIARLAPPLNVAGWLPRERSTRPAPEPLPSDDEATRRTLQTSSRHGRPDTTRIGGLETAAARCRDGRRGDRAGLRRPRRRPVGVDAAGSVRLEGVRRRRRPDRRLRRGGADMSTRRRVELAANTNGQARRSELRDVRRAGRVLDTASVEPDVGWLAGIRGFTTMCADNGYRR